MSPKTYNLALALCVICFGLPLTAAFAQSDLLPEACHFLVFEDRRQVQVRGFSASNANLDSSWKKALANILQNALIESNCFNVRRMVLDGVEPNERSHPPLYYIKGNVLSFSDFPAELTLVLEVEEAESGRRVLNDTIIEVADGRIPVSTKKLYGVELSPSLFSSPKIPLIKRSMAQIIQKLRDLPPPEKPREDIQSQRKLLPLMILPNLENFQAIKEELQNNPATKAIIHSISKALEDQGYIVKDFLESLKKNEEEQLTRTHLVIDPFQVLMENAPTDLLIYVDIDIKSGNSGTQVQILLTVKDRYTAQRYFSTPLLHSTKRHWPDLQYAAQEALHRGHALDDFVQGLDDRLRLLLKQGRKSLFYIELSGQSDFSLDTPIYSSETLKIFMIDWLRQRSVGGQTQIMGSLPRLLQVEVTLPLSSSEERYLSPLDHGLAFQFFVRELLEQYQIPYKEVELKGLGGRVELMIY